MDKIVKRIEVITKPDNIKVSVEAVFSVFDNGDQYCVLHVGNPSEECYLYFAPFYQRGKFGGDMHFLSKYCGDHRFTVGGNTTLHGYSDEDAEMLLDLLIEEFINSVWYSKRKFW